MKKIFSLSLMAVALLISGQMKANEAKIGSQEYPTFDAAIAAVQNGETITLIDDVEHAAGFYLCDGKAITIDMDGHDILDAQIINHEDYATAKAASVWCFLCHGSLTIKGQGQINFSDEEPKEHTMTLISVSGSTDPAKSNYSVLTIENGVVINYTGEHYGNGVSLTYNTGAYNNGKIDFLAKDVAYGAVINLNCEIRSHWYSFSSNGSIQGKEGDNIPVVNILEDAVFVNNGGSDDTYTAVYCAAYAIYNIYGNITGEVGLYAKAGVINIGGEAKITSSTTDSKDVVPTGNGVKGGDGNAIIIDSKDGYAGDIVVNVSGNPTITASTGYALYEVNTDAPVNHTEGINISGGNFVGGGKGCVSTTPEVQQEIAQKGSITGGNYTGANTEDEIKSLLSTTEGVIIPVVNEYGETVYVVGEKPEGKVWKNSISEASDNDYVKITTTGSETLTADKVLTYLTIVSDYTVTVPAGKTLSVGEIVLDELAKIVVEAGGKLIVNGTNGIVAFNADNLQLKATAESSAIFMLNPAVKANKNPKATVELVSTSFVNGSEFQNQRIAIPFINAPENLVSEDDVEVRFMRYNDNTDQWDNLGYLNKSAAHSTGADLDLESLDAPFADFLITVYNTTPGKKLTFTGNLVGISSEKMAMKANWWNSFGNSYIAKMSIKQLLEKLETEFSGSQENIAIYVQKSIGNNKFEWKPITAAELIISTNKQNIDAMETFMIKNDGGAMELDIDYNDLIWTPSQQ